MTKEEIKLILFIDKENTKRAEEYDPDRDNLPIIFALMNLLIACMHSRDIASKKEKVLLARKAAVDAKMLCPAVFDPLCAKMFRAIELLNAKGI